MYLLSQLWLYLLLACLAGLVLGLLLNRFGQRGHAAELAALQARLDALDAEHRQTSARALALSASVDEHLVARQGLDAELESLQGRLGALQTAYESRLTLLNTETSRAVQLSDALADLQTRHAALEHAHHIALANHADVAKEAYESLLNAQSERDVARQAAVDTEAELVQVRESAALAAGAASAVALAARQGHQDALATLEQQRLALADDRDRQLAVLNADLERLRDQHTALQRDLGHHQSLLSTETGRGADLLAALAALQGTFTATVAAHAAQATAAQQQATEASRAQADAIAALEAERASVRQELVASEATMEARAARVAELESELTREREAAMLAAGVAATAALTSHQAHQEALVALEQQQAGLVEQVAQRDRQIAELQATVADEDAAWLAAERQAQDLRDAQDAGQSAAQLREQALQQELAQSQSRAQELEAELRALQLTLADNDAQIAALNARLQAERDQQQWAQARITELAALVPPPAPAVPVVVRPAVSAAASLTGAELERLVLEAGEGQQPAPVEIDHQRPDDLKIIGGIGPVNAHWLHVHGVHYFWQIASWSPAELAWVANHLPNFGSRVYRENWIAQAADLAAQGPMG